MTTTRPLVPAVQSRPRHDCRILYVVNDASFFLLHWAPLARGAQQAGYDVHVATPGSKSEYVSRIIAMGWQHHEIPFTRSKVHFRGEWMALRALWQLYRDLAPAVVHHVTIKPVLYGSLVARWCDIRSIVNALPGLGYVFLATGWKAALRRMLVESAYRTAFSVGNQRIVFQNPDDVEQFITRRVVRPDVAVLIRGCGVDLQEYQHVPEYDGTPMVLLAARLLVDKGVREFVTAARSLREGGVTARFVLVGNVDEGNPSTIQEHVVKQWVSEGTVEWWGYRNDMPHVLRQAHVICLPSYREGLPKVLLEAAATGRAIVTTNVPGCREVVTHLETGLLVPPRDALALRDALAMLLVDPELRRRLGINARARAETEFSVESVTAATLGVYEELVAIRKSGQAHPGTDQPFGPSDIYSKLAD